MKITVTYKDKIITNVLDFEDLGLNMQLSEDLIKKTFKLAEYNLLNAIHINDNDNGNENENENEIAKAIKTVIVDYPDETKKHIEGDVNLFGFFVGKVTRLLNGKANPIQINEMLCNAFKRIKEGN